MEFCCWSCQLDIHLLTHWVLATWSYELHHHHQWLVACLAPSHYLNQCSLHLLLIITIMIKLQHRFLWRQINLDVAQLQCNKPNIFSMQWDSIKARLQGQWYGWQHGHISCHLHTQWQDVRPFHFTICYINIHMMWLSLIFQKKICQKIHLMD